MGLREAIEGEGRTAEAEAHSGLAKRRGGESEVRLHGPLNPSRVPPPNKREAITARHPPQLSPTAEAVVVAALPGSSRRPSRSTARTAQSCCSGGRSQSDLRGRNNNYNKAGYEEGGRGTNHVPTGEDVRQKAVYWDFTPLLHAYYSISSGGVGEGGLSQTKTTGWEQRDASPPGWEGEA